MIKVTNSRKFIELPKIYGVDSSVELPKILRIPSISYDELISLYNKIKPIAEFNGQKFLLRDFNTRELSSYPFLDSIATDIRVLVDPYKLETIEEFLCLSSWANYGYFRPTISEVLAQTSSNVRDYANAFEIVEQPKTRDDVFKYNSVIGNGYHLSKVRAYKLHK